MRVANGVNSTARSGLDAQPPFVFERTGTYLHRTDEGTRLAGWVLVVASILCGALPGLVFVIGLLAMLVSSEFQPALLGLLVLPALGAVLLMIGLSILRSRVRIEIGAVEVRVSVKARSSSTSWSCPLAEYQRLALRTVVRRVRHGNKQDFIHVLDLVHQEPDKYLRITDSRSIEVLRPLLSTLSEKLGIEGVEEPYEQAAIVHGVGEEALRQARQAAGQDEQRQSIKAPPFVEVLYLGRAVEITHKSVDLMLAGLALLLLLLPGIAVYMGFAMDFVPVWVAYLGMAGCMGVVYLFVRFSGRRPGLRVSRHGVVLFTETRGGRLEDERIKAPEIIEVKIEAIDPGKEVTSTVNSEGKSVLVDVKCLMVVSAERTIRFGEHWSTDQLTWLHREVTAALD